MSWPPQIGEVLPRAGDAYGVQIKLRAYSLNQEHKVGGHKARAFRRALGITFDDADYLAERLLAGIHEAPIRVVRDIAPHGVVCGVLVPVRGLRDHTERTVVVTTSWQLRFETDAPRLVTAYLKGYT